MLVVDLESISTEAWTSVQCLSAWLPLGRCRTFGTFAAGKDAVPEQWAPICATKLEETSLSWQQGCSRMTIVTGAAPNVAIRTIAASTACALVSAGAGGVPAWVEVAHSMVSEARSADSRVVVVGTIMKAEREADMCQRGLLHMDVQQGVLYVPVDIKTPLERQSALDVLLVKATDSLTVNDRSGSIEFSKDLHLICQQAEAAGTLVVDSLDKVAVVADRWQLRQALAKLEDRTSGRVRLSSAVLLRDDSDLRKLLADGGLQGDAVLMKPQVACGVSASHSMALVVDAAGLYDWVHFPTVAETFYNHQGVQFKCYTIGPTVLCVVKPSIPNVEKVDADDSASHLLLGGVPFECQAPHRYHFHSLDSLPIASRSEVAHVPAPAQELIQQCSDAIRACLGLTLFGFDVIQPSDQRTPLVLIDVNAFPSFKGFPDAACKLRSTLRDLVIASR